MTTEPKRSRAEEDSFVESLRHHGQLAEEDCGELPPGATHQVETDEGERRVRRKRFSAI